MTNPEFPTHDLGHQLHALAKRLELPQRKWHQMTIVFAYHDDGVWFEDFHLKALK